MVKVFITIFALLVVALSVLPCCPTDNCAGEETKTEQAGSHEDETNTCSPFYSCATCIGFTVSGWSAEPVKLLLLHTSSLFSEYRLSHFTRYHHSIWQPPRLS